jgi:hypothetical protein
MTPIERIAKFFSDVLMRRRLRWVEISVTRAWSGDMAPRLFDVRPSDSWSSVLSKRNVS